MMINTVGFGARVQANESVAQHFNNTGYSVANYEQFFNSVLSTAEDNDSFMTGREGLAQPSKFKSVAYYAVKPKSAYTMAQEADTSYARELSKDAKQAKQRVRNKNVDVAYVYQPSTEISDSSRVVETKKVNRQVLKITLPSFQAVAL